MVISITKLPKINATTGSRIAWHKLLLEEITAKYTVPLNDMLENRFPETCHERVWYEMLSINDIERILTDIVAAMKKLSSQLASQRFNKAIKPYWCKELTAASKEEKRL